MLILSVQKSIVRRENYHNIKTAHHYSLLFIFWPPPIYGGWYIFKETVDSWHKSFNAGGHISNIYALLEAIKSM